MTQDNNATADELLSIGREMFGDVWAEHVEGLIEEFEITETPMSLPGAGNDMLTLHACTRCGTFVFDPFTHRSYHRLLTVGIHFAQSVTTSNWARTELLSITKAALEEIAAEDYRGPRPRSIDIAAAAIAAISSGS